MPVPVLEKGPYVFNVNNLYSESTAVDCMKRALLELKNCLVALGGAGTIWTVVASSNSVSVKNIGDASPDLWSGLSDLVYATYVNPRSWCILENSTTGGQLLINWETQSGYGYDAGMAYSPGGTYASDGTTSSVPTSTDSGLMWYRAYHWVPTSGAYYKVVVNVMTSADHKITRFYLHFRVNSGTLAGGAIGLIEDAQDTPSVWNSAIKTIVSYNSWHMATSDTSYLKSPRGSDVDNGSSFMARVETAEPYAAWLSAYPLIECYTGFEGAYGDPLTLINSDLGMSGGYPVCPIGIFRANNSKGGHLGRLADIYWAQLQHQTLDTYPEDSSHLWVKWGCFMVPWNGTTPQDAV